MAEERRAGYAELLESIRDFKTDIKEDIKEIKDELKHFDQKVKDHIDMNNKLYHNGFTPDKHVQDHHDLNQLKEEKKETKSVLMKVFEEVLKYIAIGAVTWVGFTIWSGMKAEIQSPIDTKPKVEYHAKESN